MTPQQRTEKSHELILAVTRLNEFAGNCPETMELSARKLNIHLDEVLRTTHELISNLKHPQSMRPNIETRLDSLVINRGKLELKDRKGVDIMAKYFEENQVETDEVETSVEIKEGKTILTIQSRLNYD